VDHPRYKTMTMDHVAWAVDAVSASAEIVRKLPQRDETGWFGFVCVAFMRLLCEWRIGRQGGVDGAIEKEWWVGHRPYKDHRSINRQLQSGSLTHPCSHSPAISAIALNSSVFAGRPSQIHCQSSSYRPSRTNRLKLE